MWTFAIPGSVRNVVEIGRGKAFFSEHLQRSVDDLAGPRLLASAPFRFVIRRSRKHRRAGGWRQSTRRCALAGQCVCAHALPPFARSSACTGGAP
jgi:hypothetical protein